MDRDRERGATWEVEITKLDGTSADVLVDDQFRVIDVGGEREAGEPDSREDSDDDHDDEG